MTQQSIAGDVTAAMECDACYLPFMLTEQSLSRPLAERQVECRCPECGQVVANVVTQHELVIAHIH